MIGLSHCFKLFLFFRFQDGGEVKYLDEASDLVKPERNTLEVSFADVEKHNHNLATTILEEYYRYVMYRSKLCNVSQCIGQPLIFSFLWLPNWLIWSVFTTCWFILLMSVDYKNKVCVSVTTLKYRYRRGRISHKGGGRL